MKRFKWLALIIVIVIALAAYFLRNRPAEVRWFEDQSYNFGVLRTLGEGPYGGSDVGEVLAALQNVREGDDESWFIGWETMAGRVEEAAGKIKNPVGKGRALLRAANYYRTAEFFLAPEDPRRKESFPKSVAAFEKGLVNLGIAHDVLSVPYESGSLKAVYYHGGPGAKDKPLILAHGGFDSTLEEIYFFIAAAALERGYDCLIFAGPGQGSALRKYGLKFTPEWEKPTGAVLDRFIEQFGRPKRIVMVGISLGGVSGPQGGGLR